MARNYNIDEANINEMDSMQDLDTSLPEGADVPAKKERKTYTLSNGQPGSQAAFIREKFVQDNMSRREIADQFGFEYRVVYSATLNMTNTAEKVPGTRTVAPSVINVTEDNRVVVTKEEGTFVNGELVEDITELGELHEVSRNAWIKEQLEAGASRGEVADWLNISYGVVYAATKEMTGSPRGGAAMITDADGNSVSRADYIRKQFEAGVSRGDIAKELQVPYNVVWQATKVNKTLAEKFAAAIEAIRSYADKVSDPDTLGQAVELLSALEVQEDASTTTADENAAE